MPECRFEYQLRPTSMLRPLSLLWDPQTVAPRHESLRRLCLRQRYTPERCCRSCPYQCYRSNDAWYQVKSFPAEKLMEGPFPGLEAHTSEQPFENYPHRYPRND